MKIYRRKRNDILILQPEGEISLDTISNFLIYVKNLIQNSSSKIVLNLSKVDYISSLGIRSLIEISHLIHSLNGGFALCELNPHVKKVFETVSFERVAVICKSEDEAVLVLMGASAIESQNCIQ